MSENLIQGAFGDFESFESAVCDWSLDFRQLDAGPLDANLLQAFGGSFAFSWTRLSRHFEQRGTAPAGMRTLGVLARGYDGLRFCGRAVGADEVLALHSRGDFESVSPPGFEISLLSISEAALQERAEALEIPDLEAVLDERESLVSCAPRAMARLRGAVESFQDTLRQTTTADLPAARLESLGSQLPDAYLLALASGHPQEWRPPSASSRARARDHALERIRENPDEPVSVKTLCEAAGVSERTLQYAFLEAFGVSPRAYLTAYRLDGVRRALVTAAPKTKIVDVANDWGFWHMGQFARAYRRQFGELPSQTLSQSQGPAAR